MSKKSNGKNPTDSSNKKRELPEIASLNSEAPVETIAETHENTVNCVYLGPTIPKIAKHGTVYEKGILPERLEQLAVEMPAVRSLIVPLDRLNAMLKSINRAGSAEGRIYKAIKEKYKEVR